MKKEVESALDAIFEAHGAKVKQQQDAEKAKVDRELEFLGAFYRHSDEVIQPAFEAVGVRVKQNGYDYRVSSQAESIDGQGRQLNARITISFIVNSDGKYHRNEDYPHLSVICEKHRFKLRLHESTISPRSGGSAGSSGEFELEQVNEELLHKHLVNLLSVVLK